VRDDGSLRDRTIRFCVPDVRPPQPRPGVSNHEPAEPRADRADDAPSAVGNAIDAAIARLSRLTVDSTPRMFGSSRRRNGEYPRTSDGSHRFIDGQTRCHAVVPDTYRSTPGSAQDVFDTVEDENWTGPKARRGCPAPEVSLGETLRRLRQLREAVSAEPRR